MSQKAKYENKGRLYSFVINCFLINLDKIVNKVSPAKILDVGCADGYVIKFLKNRHPDIYFEGVDIDRKALDGAREMNDGVVFQEVGIFDVSDKIGDKFDLVMAIEVLEHIADYRRAVEALSRLNADWFLLSVPREPFFQLINLFRGKYLETWGNVPDHVNRWSKRSFRKVVSEKFDIVGDFSFFPWTVVLAKRRRQE